MAATPDRTDLHDPFEAAISVRTVIDADEYEEALRDPRVGAFLADSLAYVERLQREGRSF